MELPETEYLLSIIIPTRNRQEYAFYACKQVLDHTPENVQVVIQDNSDDCLLIDRLNDNPFKNRIKYNYSNKELSFVENFSQGVENSDGEYICIIGDDDGINPQIVEIVKWAKLKKVHAILPEIKLNYIWPDSGIKSLKNDNGNLYILSFNSRVKYFKTSIEIKKLLNSGGQKYLNYNLVKIYHGIVTRSSMDQVKKITGKYFGGLSPDIYSSIALSLVIEEVVKVDYPFTIPGVCKKSGSGQASTGKHIGELKEAPHFRGQLDYIWSEKVPPFYSVETIWADSALAALNDMNKKELIDQFNVFALTVYCFINGRRFYKLIKNNFNNYNLNLELNIIQKFFKLLISYVQGPFFDYINKIHSRIFRKIKVEKRFNEVNNIQEASQIVTKYLIENKNSINDLFHELNKY